MLQSHGDGWQGDSDPLPGAQVLSPLCRMHLGNSDCRMWWRGRKEKCCLGLGKPACHPERRKLHKHGCFGQKNGVWPLQRVKHMSKSYTEEGSREGRLDLQVPVPHPSGIKEGTPCLWKTAQYWLDVQSKEMGRNNALSRLKRKSQFFKDVLFQSCTSILTTQKLSQHKYRPQKGSIVLDNRNHICYLRFLQK